jgi:hypothetical protein
MYTNMPIVDENRKQPYSDTPKPRVFGKASPFDPQMFATVDEAAGAKVSQREVSQWLSGLASHALRALAEIPAKDTAENRRWRLDIQILSGLGLFFSNKISAAVFWHEFEVSGNESQLARAIDSYGIARKAWAEFAKLAEGKYSNDITYGSVRHMRGHWMDRLADIDGDIEDMKKRLTPGHTATDGLQSIDRIMDEFQHTPPQHFRPGSDVEIVSGKKARLWYRHVNQAERWQSVDAVARGKGGYRAVIPAVYTNTKYPLQYYFNGGWDSVPGFGRDHDSTPYFVIRPKS